MSLWRQGFPSQQDQDHQGQVPDTDVLDWDQNQDNNPQE